jgi:methylated-DNA-protein-cysteine methyltransferase related protein
LSLPPSNQQRIWQTVRLVPYGRVATYGQIADLAGLPGRARLVGKSLSCVPENMPIPWFKVLRSDGKIAFPPGSQLANLQVGLLQQEDIVVMNNRVKLTTYQWQPDLAEMLWKLSR